MQTNGKNKVIAFVTNVRTTKQAINYKLLLQYQLLQNNVTVTYIHPGATPGIRVPLSGNAPLVQEPYQEQTFNEIKALLMHVNAYSALCFHFDTYMDTSNYQWMHNQLSVSILIPIWIQTIISWVWPLYWHLC